MYEGLAAHVIGLLSHVSALTYFVNGDGEVRTGGDVSGVLLGSGITYEQVVKITNLSYLVDTGVGAGASLVDDDGLNVGIGAVLVDYGDELLLLGHEVIGHGVVDYTIAVLLYHSLGGTIFFFVLGYGVGDDGDLALGSGYGCVDGALNVIGIPNQLSSGSSFLSGSGFFSSGLCASCQGQSQGENQHQRDELLHSVFSSLKKLT